MNPIQNHIRFIVTCVTILVGMCIVMGGFLLWKGYSGGDVLVSQAGVGIGGLIGMLSMRGPAAPPADPPVQPPVNPTP